MERNLSELTGLVSQAFTLLAAAFGLWSKLSK